MRKRILKLSSILLVVGGIILFIFNFFRIIPENELLKFLVAYGFLLGPVMAMFGIALWQEEDD